MRNRRPRQKLDYSKSPLREITAKVPEHVYQYLDNLSRISKTSMSILIARSIINEIDCPQPFHQDLSEPETGSGLDAEIDHQAANFIIDYVTEHPGLSLEHLFMLRESFGVPDKTVFLGCYYYLLRGYLLRVDKRPSGYHGIHVTNGARSTDESPLPLPGSEEHFQNNLKKQGFKI